MRVLVGDQLCSLFFPILPFPLLSEDWGLLCLFSPGCSVLEFTYFVSAGLQCCWFHTWHVGLRPAKKKFITEPPLGPSAPFS